ncbi:MAG TPA: methyl-accepting chemotaxis protein [Accumulibacter sp.]|nr:methyl-accepting chemotaxis protein [Accumulibacter sp.]HMW17572.1 methyl-accepting chemotaxis protein [Accumulibacter sp.]HMX21998.1 methyl-accepting chemotaxis protein [Accumulibacter sp.]HNC17028.1 methyl-accepting chemotaxis protein [Accumulibacter sp.]HND79670.1 methyl-accepting chemotaxis protein [Accumulibacter sp.]
MKSLHKRLTCLVSALITLSMLIFGAAFYLQMRSQLIDSVASETRGTATGFALATGEWITSKTQMVNALKSVIVKPDAEKFFVTTKLVGGFDSVYAGFPDKRSVFSEEQSDLPADWDPTARPWYQDAMRAGATQVVVTKPYEDAGNKKLVISISSLVKEGEHVIGVVAADLFIDRVVGEVLGIKLAGEGFGFLLHQDGTMLAHPVKESVMKPASERFPDLTPERIAQAKTTNTMFETRTSDGNRFLFLAPIKGTDWVLGVSLDKAKVLAPLDRLLISLVLALLITAGVTAFLVRYVLGRMLRGLLQVRGKMVEISRGGGDLRVRLNVLSDDEVGETARSFNQFLDQLQRMVISLKDEAQRLSTDVVRLDDNINHLASESVNLTESSRANAVAVEDITQAASKIADNAQDTDQLIRATGELSLESAREVDAVAADAEISIAHVNELARVMANLDSRSQEISSIINVIKGIADQTNLLALNAAIEAARAGEQGRGFAVVADEVRKLAERTARATVEITGKISAVHEETSQAGLTVDSAVESVSRSVERSHLAAQRIKEISAKMNEAISRVGEIAQSTLAQRHATTAMVQTSELTSQRVEAEDHVIQEARITLSALSGNAQNTCRLLDGFHV